MKKVFSSSRTGLFLIELVIVILFFALSATVCMKLFAFAYTMTEYSADISHAAAAAQNTAECFKAAEGDIVKTAELLGAVFENNKLSYNPDDDITLTLITDTEKSDLSVNGIISVADKNKKIIFELEIIALRGIDVIHK